jgi:hypothetical protein
MELKDIPVTVRLRADQVNLILAKLVLCPYGEVAELITTLKQQGDAALMVAQRAQPLPPPGSNGVADTETLPVV